MINRNKWIKVAIENKLYMANDIRNAVNLARLDQDNRRGKTGGNRSGCSLVSDPTAVKAIRHVMPLRFVKILDFRGNEITIFHPEAWLECIDKAKEHLDKESIAVMELRYDQRIAPPSVAMKSNISTKTLYNWCDKYIDFISLLAVEKGLIKPVPQDE